MKTIYHRQITRQALEQHLGVAALEVVITANLGQDALRYQVGHDHFHYDANSFAASDSYVETCHTHALQAARLGQIQTALEEFGRLTHTVQDFYAHSNYITLWREQNPEATPEQIDPLQVSLIKSPRLCSGKLYYPLEVLSFLPPFQPLVLPLLPRDSHAWMNKDDPSRPDFAYALAAAIRRTTWEWQRLTQMLSRSEIEKIQSHTKVENTHGHQNPVK